MLNTATWWTNQSVSKAIHRRSWWMDALGILLIVFGVFALGCVVTTSFISVFIIGGLLIAAGVAQIIATFAYWTERRGSFGLGLILGCLGVIAGLLCLTQPARGLMVLTFILAIDFIVSGMARLTITLIERFPGWGWGVASGVIELVLGIFIVAALPSASMVILGVLLGIQLIVAGINAITTGSAVRRFLGAVTEMEPPKPVTRFQH
jgi:uncharacterized membrane protein HdeD (DUF308 family)